MTCNDKLGSYFGVPSTTECIRERGPLIIGYVEVQDNENGALIKSSNRRRERQLTEKFGGGSREWTRGR